MTLQPLLRNSIPQSVVTTDRDSEVPCRGLIRVYAFPEALRIRRACASRRSSLRVTRPAYHVASFWGSKPQVLDWATLGGNNRRCCAASYAAEATVTTNLGGDFPRQNYKVTARRLNLKRWRAILSLNVVFATGCGRWQSVTPPIIHSQRTVTVSASDPFIDMEDGTRIPVDDLSPGQSSQLMVTQYRDSNGKISVGVDTVADSIPTREKP